MMLCADSKPVWAAGAEPPAAAWSGADSRAAAGRPAGRCAALEPAPVALAGLAPPEPQPASSRPATDIAAAQVTAAPRSPRRRGRTLGMPVMQLRCAATG